MNKELFKKLEELKGAKFVGVKRYLNNFGELSNNVVLMNASVMNAKKNDQTKLVNFSKEVGELKKLVDKNVGRNFDVAKVALSELLVSGEKNLSENIEDRTAQSRAQTEAYMTISRSIKVHVESEKVYITGFNQSKEILVKGVYPPKKSREKTLCKEMIKKHLKLRMLKYRPYMVGKLGEINITGTTIQC